MGFFDIFRTRKDHQQPNIKFGRFSDSNKEKDKYIAWDHAIRAFEKTKYLKSFCFFLDYLSIDELENVFYSEQEDKVEFKIFQGSKIILGEANKEKVIAQAKIARTRELHIGFLRRLVELNFGLKYTRYALDEDNQITMVFESKMLDGSPYKMYAALKELALGADKQDDILLSEFGSLEPINMGHIQELDDSIKEQKFVFMQTQIDRLLQEMQGTKLDIIKYPGAISYMLLNTVYTLLYLLNAKGYTADVLERIHQDFFENETDSLAIRNQRMLGELKKLRQTTKHDFFDELYQIKATFGLTLPSSHSRLSNFIRVELKNMDWYESNGHRTICRSILGYIVGYCLFSYGLPNVDARLLHVYYVICYPSYFENLGFNYSYKRKGRINRSVLHAEIKSIIREFKVELDASSVDYSILDYSSENEFAKSLLIFIQNLRPYSDQN